MAVGGGMYWLGVSATVLTLAGLELLTVLFKNLGLRTMLVHFTTTRQENLVRILDQVHQRRYRVVSYKAAEEKHGELCSYRVSLVVKIKEQREEQALFHLHSVAAGLGADRNGIGGPMPGILLPLPPQTDRKMKKRITEQDYLKAHRKASREEEIARHGRPVGQSRVHRSKKAYDRKKTKAGLKRLPFDFIPALMFPHSHLLRSLLSCHSCTPLFGREI